MSLRVIGAGLPRTGTSSLKQALARLLGKPCLHMSAFPNHPFDLGPAWHAALFDEPTDWKSIVDGYVGAVDWPTSLFWKELSRAHPEALIVLSTRDDEEQWFRSFEEFVARPTREAGDKAGDLLLLMRRFAGSKDWDNVDLLKHRYQRHNEEVLATADQNRLLVWKATDGWVPICDRLGVAVPDEPFPWVR